MKKYKVAWKGLSERHCLNKYFNGGIEPAMQVSGRRMFKVESKVSAKALREKASPM